MVKRKIKDTPILFLDDVLSELDSSRQNYLLDSISDIQTLLNPLTDHYFGNKDGFNMEDIYNEVFNLEQEESGKLLKDLGKKYSIAQQTFQDFPEEDQQFLQNFSFICLLSYDVYIKKMIIESVIDQLPHENAHSSKKETGKSSKKDPDKTN